MKWLVGGVGAVVVALALFGTFAAIQDQIGTPAPGYQTGEIVELIINGERAQIIDVLTCRHSTGCLYSVRIPGASRLAYMHEFEIRKAKP